MAKRTPMLPPAADPLHFITPDLRQLAVPIGELVQDPHNAMLHGSENLAAIARSLSQFGQRTPLVVNRKSKQIEKGNGTHRAALSLGWSHVAVVWVEDDPSTQVGYSIADNRTAELAEWDFAVLESQLATLEGSDLYADLLLDDLRQLDAAEDEEPAAAGGSVAVPDTFQIVVEVEDEEQQKELFTRLKTEGYSCRVLTM